MRQPAAIMPIPAVARHQGHQDHGEQDDGEPRENQQRPAEYLVLPQKAPMIGLPIKELSHAHCHHFSSCPRHSSPAVASAWSTPRKICTTSMGRA